MNTSLPFEKEEMFRDQLNILLDHILHNQWSIFSGEATMEKIIAEVKIGATKIIADLMGDQASMYNVSVDLDPDNPETFFIDVSVVN